MRLGVLGMVPAALLAQSGPACPPADTAGRYCVTVAIENGVTVIQKPSTLTAGAKPFPAGAQSELDKYLDEKLAKLGRPYRRVLSEEGKKEDDAKASSDPDQATMRSAKLSLSEYFDVLQRWCDAHGCQAGAILSPAGLYRDFAKYQDAPLLFDPEQDSFSIESGLVMFRVPQPLDSDEIDIRLPGLDESAAKKRVADLKKQLSSLNGKMFNRDRVVERLTSYYDPLGLDPDVLVRLDGPPQPSISIIEGPRIKTIAFPFGAPVKNGRVDWRKTEIALYGTLSDGHFRGGYLKNRDTIRDLISRNERPALDLHGDFSIALRDLPYASKVRIPVQQMLMQQDGVALSISGVNREFVKLPASSGGTDDVEFLTVTLRLEDISQSPPRDDAPPAAAVPIDANGAAAPHDAEATPQISFLKPTPTVAADRRRHCEDCAAKPKARYLGFGGQYLPGQGLRLFTLVQQSQLRIPQMDASVSARAGTGGGWNALTTANFSADYIAFERIHRRIALSLTGGQDSQSDRHLTGGYFDERRRGAIARLELELFRDRGGHLLKFFGEGHREAVRLFQDSTDTRRYITAFDFGATHIGQSENSMYPWALRLEPVIRFAPATSEVASFQRGGVSGRYHRVLPARFAIDLASRFEQASKATPEFELPSLGGQESVRGFRRDDALGHRLWSAQSELWTPVPWLQKNDFVRQSVRAALFFDAGNAYRRNVQTPAARRGAGLGARVTYGPLILRADAAYGFGDAAAGGRRFKLYFGATLNLPK